MRVEVNVSGPIFDGRADAAVSDFLEEAKDDIGQQAHADVMRLLNANIKHPTPYYETQITTERRGSNVVVHDRGIIYGHWLEGTGSRNAPVTRFPGYHSFRDATELVLAEAKTLAERVLRRYLRRMQ